MNPSLTHNFSFMDDKVSDCLKSIWSKAIVFEPHPIYSTCHRCALTMSKNFEDGHSFVCATESGLGVRGNTGRHVVARHVFSIYTDRTSCTGDAGDNSHRQFIVIYLITSKSRLQFSTCGCQCHERPHNSLQTYLVFRRHRNHHRPLHHHHHHHHHHRLLPSPIALDGSEAVKRRPEIQSSKDLSTGGFEAATTRQRHHHHHHRHHRNHGLDADGSQQISQEGIGSIEPRPISVRWGARSRHGLLTTRLGHCPDSRDSGVSLASLCRRKSHWPVALTSELSAVAPVAPVRPVQSISSMVLSMCRSESSGREFQLYILHVPTSALTSSSYSSSSSRISNFLISDFRDLLAAKRMMMIMTMPLMVMMVMMRMGRKAVMVSFGCQCPVDFDLVVSVVTATVAADDVVVESPVIHRQSRHPLDTRMSGSLGLLRYAELQCYPSASSSSSLLFSSSLSLPSLTVSPSSPPSNETDSIAHPSRSEEKLSESLSPHDDDNDNNDDGDDYFCVCDRNCHSDFMVVNRPTRRTAKIDNSFGRISSIDLLLCFSFLYQLLVTFCSRRSRGYIDDHLDGDQSDSSRTPSLKGVRRPMKEICHDHHKTTSSEPILNRTFEPRLFSSDPRGGGNGRMPPWRFGRNIWSLPVLLCLALFTLCSVDGVPEVSAHMGLPNPGGRHVPRHFHLRNLCSSRYLTISTSLPTASADNLVAATNITAESVGPSSLIRMKNRLNHYLCFSRDGSMKSKKHPDETCNFYEIHTRDHKTEFQSSFNVTWFVGFDRTGCPLSGESRLMSHVRRTGRPGVGQSSRLKRPRTPSNRALALAFESRLLKIQRRHAAAERQSRAHDDVLNDLDVVDNSTVRIRRQRRQKIFDNSNDSQRTTERLRATQESDQHHHTQLHQHQQQEQQQKQHRRRHSIREPRDRKSQNGNRKRKCQTSRERQMPDKCFQFVKDTPRSSLHHHPHQSPSSKN